MKWFCQVVWSYFEIWIPTGYNIQMSIAMGTVIVLGLWALKELSSIAFPDFDQANGTKKGFKQLLKDLVGDAVVEKIEDILGMPVYTLWQTLKFISTGYKAVSAAFAAVSGGIGAVVDLVIRAVMAIIANWMFNQLAIPLIRYVGMATTSVVTNNNVKNTIRTQADLIFFNPSFSLLKT
ncbi:MAG: hypothetical protein LBU60_06390 [Clostridiales bacterium]|jgi:hypothetical protein|nr:hypothetical protein [Clostridiales bacterium]